MHGGMAVHAGVRESHVRESNVGALARTPSRHRVERPWMSGVRMAALAEERPFLREQFLMGGAVRRVTRHAVFLNRSMVPDERPAHLGMALKTLLVGSIRTD